LIHVLPGIQTQNLQEEFAAPGKDIYKTCQEGKKGFAKSAPVAADVNGGCNSMKKHLAGGKEIQGKTKGLQHQLKYTPCHNGTYNATPKQK
jgi:hypothetical protein